jgi:hypothetical protein
MPTLSPSGNDSQRCKTKNTTTFDHLGHAVDRDHFSRRPSSGPSANTCISLELCLYFRSAWNCKPASRAASANALTRRDRQNHLIEGYFSTPTALAFHQTLANNLDRRRCRLYRTWCCSHFNFRRRRSGQYFAAIAE